MNVIKYSYKNQRHCQLTAHFKVFEFASLSGSKLYSDEILIDSGLVLMLEKLFSTLKASKCIITSGYRTPAHDKAVGGNGRGQHTKGTAVDCYFLDKKGNRISSKIISCVAQDMGFNGIANINSSYTTIHLDTGNRSKKYLGDETKGTNSVTTDFYKYYGYTRAQIKKITGVSVISYYGKVASSFTSLVDALKFIKVDSSRNYRAKIAKANGITIYTGTSNQNTKLLNLLKQGKLIKP